MQAEDTGAAEAERPSGAELLDLQPLSSPPFCSRTHAIEEARSRLGGQTPSCPPATCAPPRESLNLLGPLLVGTEGTELSLSTSLTFSLTIDDMGMMTDST